LKKKDFNAVKLKQWAEYLGSGVWNKILKRSLVRGGMRNGFDEA